MTELKLWADETKLLDVDDKKQVDINDLASLFIKIIPVAWNEILDIHHPELRDAGLVLNKLMQRKGQEIVPRPWNVFRALALTPPAMVRVVIIGQDPYFAKRNDRPSATGLCFECAEDMPIEKSLAQILIRLKISMPGFDLPKHGRLTKWAEQGVLLLNAALTTSVGEPNAHAAIWEFFPKRILEYLAKTQKHVVYMLWGKYAQQHVDKIDKSDNLVLEASHPVAHGASNTFMSCNHFAEANEYLVAHGRTPIDWRL